MKEQEQNFNRTGPRPQMATGDEQCDNFGYKVTPSKWTKVIGYIVLMVVCGTSSVMGIKIGNQMTLQQKMVQSYQDRYKYKHGWTSDYKGHSLAYCLFSNNGGRNWYAIKENLHRDKSGEITGSSRDEAQIILGPVEDIYPGLLADIQATDDYVARVKWLVTEGVTQ